MIKAKQISASSKYLVPMLGVLALDQASKFYLTNQGTLVLNHGGIFGIFPSKSWIIILCFFWFWLASLWLSLKDSRQKLALAFILSAGLSNLIDRLVYQGVRDVIYYPWFGIYGNIADIVISISVIWVIYSELSQESDTQA